MGTTADDTVRMGDMDLRFLVDETQGSGDLVVFEFTVRSNGRVPAPHYHAAVDELVFGLEGVMTVRRGDDTHLIRKGDSLFIPRGIVHHHKNVHDADARMLIVLNPGTIGRAYFEEIAAITKVPGPPDMGRIIETMNRFGLVPAP